MPHVRIFHNPRCSKSRQTLVLLQEHNITPDIVMYLTTPPTVSELTQLLKQLNLTAHELIRRKEALFDELKLTNADEDTLIKAMVDNPILIERPIVVKGEHAVLGRPPENVLELIS